METPLIKSSNKINKDIINLYTCSKITIAETEGGWYNIIFVFDSAIRTTWKYESSEMRDKELNQIMSQYGINLTSLADVSGLKW